MNELFSSLARRYQQELYGSVIPFWEAHCIDVKYGGYFDSLARNGAVYDDEKFLWMQWRKVYMFATLYQSDPQQARWLDHARHGFDFLSKYGKDESGNYYFSLSRQGVAATVPYSIYSECFAAMGAAALYKAEGDERYRKEAESAMAKYLARIDDPKGRWEKALSGRKSYRSLGHYMMQANLGSVLNDCLKTTRYENDIIVAAETILESFRNYQYGQLLENINIDGTFDLSSCEGRHLNPGHGLEAMWFIMQYAAQAGRKDMISNAGELVLSILDFSWDKEYGGIYYFMDITGQPHRELSADMKLWWVHNEALLATLYGYYLTRDQRFMDWFLRIDEWSWSHFPDGECGEWYGYLNRRGEVVNNQKGGKWKGFFHLPRALFIASQLLTELAAAPTVNE